MKDPVDANSYPPMSDSRVCAAIDKWQRMKFKYHGNDRRGEPQCYGITKAGNEAVRFHMVEGGSRPEQLFTLAKMRKIIFLDEHFTAPGPNYQKDDSAFIHIFCQLQGKF